MLQRILQSKALSFIALNFAFGFCYACGFFSVNALLIARAGASPLFYVYLGSALFAVLSALLSCLPVAPEKKREPKWSFLPSGLLVIVSWLLLCQDATPTWVLIGIRCLSYVIVIRTSLSFWQIAGSYFTNKEARICFSHFVASEIVGIMLGGLLTEFIATSVHTVNLVFIWGIVLIIVPWVLLTKLEKPKRVDEMRTSSDLPTKEARSAMSVMLALLFTYWVVHSFLTYGIDFTFNGEAFAGIQGEDKLAEFFGRVTLVSNVVVLAYQLFLSPKLTSNYGVTFIVFGIALLFFLASSLYLLHPTLITAAIGYGVVYFFIESLAMSSLNTIITVLPEDKLDRIRAVTEGLGRPFGILLIVAVAGFYALQPNLSTIAILMFVSSLLFLAYPFLFERAYTRYLLECLRSGDQRIAVNAIQALGERNRHRAVGPLLALLREAQGPEVRRAIILSLGRIQSREAFPHLVELFPTTNWNLQEEAIRALCEFRNYEAMFVALKLIKHTSAVALETRLNGAMLLTKLLGRKMIPFLMDMLVDQDVRVQANAIEALGSLRQRGLIPLLIPFLSHANHRVRANAAIALFSFRFSFFRPHDAAARAIDELVRSPDPTAYRAGLYAISVLKLRKYESSSVERLRHAQHKSEVLWLAIGLARLKNPTFVEPLVSLLLDEDEAFACSIPRHVRDFPSYSRALLTTKLHTLQQSTRDLALKRLGGDSRPEPGHSPAPNLIDVAVDMTQASVPVTG